MPCKSDRWQSSSLPAPKACAIKVSRPSSRPIPNMVTPRKIPEPRLTAPIASGLNRPTIKVSTVAIAVQPSSATTTEARDAASASTLLSRNLGTRWSNSVA